jgi:nitroreductase
MKLVNNETILKQLNWRYATKKFDPARTIAPADWGTLEQALLLSPSSFGLQPWKFFVVRNPKVRAELREAAFNQPQVTDASHLVVFAVKRELTAADVDRHVRRTAHVRGIPVESLEGMRQAMLGTVARPPEDVRNWTQRQVYIALGNFLNTAALLGIDACPMEGFDSDKVDQILGLPDQGYRVLAFAAVGHRAEDDKYAELPKVRYAPEDVIAHV